MSPPALGLIISLLVNLPSPVRSTPSSSAVLTSGYIVDNYCWNKPNHIGIDGTNLEVSPQAHILHCLFCCSCPAQGYALLEQIPAGEANAGRYRRKYLLDDVGNTLMEALALQEHARGGDRAFSEEITLGGGVDNTNSNSIPRTLAVAFLNFTPTHNNMGGVGVCHGSCSGGGAGVMDMVTGRGNVTFNNGESSFGERSRGILGACFINFVVLLLLYGL